MSASSSISSRNDRMLEDVFNALVVVHGFSGDPVIQVDKNEIQFLGDKPTMANYAAARVELVLRRQSPRWILSFFRIEHVYITGRIDRERDSKMREINILSAQQFLDYTLREGKHWTIEKGLDVMALFRTYDQAAQDLGYTPIFLKQ